MRYALALVLLASSIGLGSCSHTATTATTARNPAQDASASPCTDVTSCKAFIVAHQTDMNLPTAEPVLYGGEEFQGKPGGTWAAERDGFLNDMSEVMAAQYELMAHHAPANDAGRVFHYKQHGCLIGELTLLPMSARKSKNGKKDAKGITNRSFLRLGNDAPLKYTVIARFSNGVGVSKNDADPDVRGMALKIFGVTNEDPGLPDDKQERVVDFNMTNSPVAFGVTQADFVEFLKAQMKQYDKGSNFFTDAAVNGEFAKAYPAAFKALVAAAGPLNHLLAPSLTERQYWAGHPYLLKDSVSGSATAMKLNLLPDHDPTVDLIKLGTNFLRNDLAAKAAAGQIGFTLQVQLEKNGAKTPIENNLQEWKEKDTPSIPVATVNFPAQVVYAPDSDYFKDKASLDQRQAAEAVDAACSVAAFTPGHYVVQDRPLSNMGRGRIFTYAASETGRHADLNGLTADQLSKWLARVQIQPGATR